MNGEPLPRIHGYPVRVVVFGESPRFARLAISLLCNPKAMSLTIFQGYIGARSVKWLYKINAIENPSLAPVQR